MKKKYSSILNIPKLEILQAWEKNRTYNAINYYQEANQPSLKNQNVKVFDTINDLKTAIGEKKFRCPACNQISTNPYKCNSGYIFPKNNKTCDWKVYGLFGHMGKGIHVFVKSEMIGNDMFMPISWKTN